MGGGWDSGPYRVNISEFMNILYAQKIRIKIDVSKQSIMNGWQYSLFCIICVKMRNISYYASLRGRRGVLASDPGGFPRAQGCTYVHVRSTYKGLYEILLISKKP